MKCYMHVNFLERVFPLDEIALRAADAGYDGIEFRGWDIDNQCSLNEYLPRAYRAAKNAKLDLVLASMNHTTSPDAEVRRRSLDDLTQLICFAADHGVHIINTFSGALRSESEPSHHFHKHGSAIARDEHFRVTADYFRQAGAIAADHKVKLCFETHSGYLHDLPDPTMRLIKLIDLDNVLVNFDFGNIFLHAHNKGLDNALAVLRGRIGYAHLKNVVSFREQGAPLYRGVPLGDGDINVYLQMRQMLLEEFRGPVAIENVTPGDRRRYITEDLIYFKAILQELRDNWRKD